MTSRKAAIFDVRGFRLRVGFLLRHGFGVTGRRDLPSSDYGMAGKSVIGDS
jgi:hypothetical protein